MNLQQLKYFVAIADCHSLTRAAHKLFVSQPYLSKVVADWEARLQKQLFIRHKSGLELTADGQRVYLLARSILRQMEQLHQLEAPAAPAADCARLSLSVGHLILPETLLPDYITTAHATRHMVDLYETTVEGCLRNVAEKRSEFAVLVADVPQKNRMQSHLARKGLDATVLDTGPVYYHVSRDHALAGRKTLRPDQLRPFPLVRLKEEADTARSAPVCGPDDPSRCILVNHYPSCLHMVKSHGAFMAGSPWQRETLEKMGIVSIRAVPARRVHLMLVRKSAVPLSPDARQWLRLFRAGCGLDGA